LSEQKETEDAICSQCDKKKKGRRKGESEPIHTSSSGKGANNVIVGTKEKRVLRPRSQRGKKKKNKTLSCTNKVVKRPSLAGGRRYFPSSIHSEGKEGVRCPDWGMKLAATGKNLIPSQGKKRKNPLIFRRAKVAKKKKKKRDPATIVERGGKKEHLRLWKYTIWC